MKKIIKIFKYIILALGIIVGIILSMYSVMIQDEFIFMISVFIGLLSFLSIINLFE